MNNLHTNSFCSCLMNETHWVLHHRKFNMKAKVGIHSGLWCLGQRFAERDGWYCIWNGGWEDLCGLLAAAGTNRNLHLGHKVASQYTSGKNGGWLRKKKVDKPIFSQSKCIFVQIDFEQQQHSDWINNNILQLKYSVIFSTQNQTIPPVLHYIALTVNHAKS